MSESLTSALETAATGVKTDFLGVAEKLAPVAIGIAAVGIAIRLGWKFFKSLSK